MTRRIVTAREQRELLSPWVIEAVEDDDRKRKPVVGEDDSKTTTETSEKDWSGDDSKPHAPGAVISQNPYAPDPYSSGSGAYYPAQFSSGGGGSGGGSSQSYGPHSTGRPSGGPPSASLTQALQKAGVDPAMYPLIQGFSAAEGNNPSGAPTLGFTDSQAGSTLDDHAQALAQQIQDRQSVAGEFPASGSPQDQASWMADVVGQNGVQSDWQGNAQPARSDYVNSIVQNMPASTPSAPVTSGPTASSPTVSPQKSGRRILTAREQREMLSPWLIEAADPGLFPQPKKVKVKHPRHPREPKELIPEGVMNQEEIPFWMSRDWRTGDGGAFNSDIRPEIPEVDVPHPSDWMKPEAWEKLKATLKDPEHDPYGVLPDDISFEDLVQGELSHLMNMNEDDAFEGRWWYPNSHEISKNVSDKTGIDHDRTVAEWSTFSPKNVWDNNIENGMQFSLNYPGRPGKPYERSMELYGDPALPIKRDKKGNPVLDKEGNPIPVFGMPAMNVDEAMAIRHAPGKSFMKFLTGPKRSSFFRNIMDASKMRNPREGHNPVEDGGYYEMPINPFTGEPDWRMHAQQSATMDTQHVRMSLNPDGTYSDQDLADLEYKTPKYFSKKRMINGKQYEVGYELQHRAHWEATRRLNAMQQDVHKHLIPMQTQAGPWIKFRKAIDRAVENVVGTVPREPGDLAQGVEPGKRPPPRGQSLGIGEEGPLTEYDVTGYLPPQQDSKKKYKNERYQRDYGDSGDPDYSQPPDPGTGRYLEPAEEYRHKSSPGKKLPGPRPRVPGTGWEPTPIDSRNEIRDLSTTRNWHHQAKKLGRRFLTAREQREMLSPWIIEADTSDDEKKKNAPTQTNWGGNGTKPSMYHIPGAEPIHNKYNTGSGEYYPAQFSSGGGGSEGTGGGGSGGSGGGHGGKNQTVLPPIDPSSYGDLNEAAKAFGQKTNGMPYEYGGTGSNGSSYDCSGLMANYYSLYTGKPLGDRPDSFNTASDFESFGFKPGYLPGAFNIGTNGGSGENGHMAGTLPDGTNVESNGSAGVQYGGNAIGAQDFPMVYHLPPPPSAAPSTPAPTTTPVSATPPPTGAGAGTPITSALGEAYRAIEAAQHLAMEWKHTYVPQDWEELDGGGYSHPSGFEIHPSDEGGFQLWAPTVRGNRLVPIKQPTNDVQALMDWAEYTQGGPKPAGQRHHLFANTALLDDPVWVQSVADAIKGGGFTFHDRPGDGPTSGYMVSTHPDREEIIPLDEMSPEDVAKFKENNVDLFQGHPENYLGGWANQDNHKFYLDVPQHDPRLWGAVDTALDNDELAIYDLGHNWDLPTEDDGQYNPLLDSHFAHRRKR